jgi:hypothetical protein
MESTTPPGEPLLEARWIFIVEETEQPMSGEPEVLQDALTQRLQNGPEIVLLEMQCHPGRKLAARVGGSEGVHLRVRAGSAAGWISPAASRESEDQ